MIHYFSATEKLSTSEPFSEFIKKLALYGKKALSFSRVSLQCSIYAFAFAGLFVGCPGFATLSEYRGRLPCYLLNINRRKCDKILDASLYKAYYSEGTIHCAAAYAFKNVFRSIVVPVGRVDFSPLAIGQPAWHRVVGSCWAVTVWSLQDLPLSLQGWRAHEGATCFSLILI